MRHTSANILRKIYAHREAIRSQLAAWEEVQDGRSDRARVLLSIADGKTQKEVATELNKGKSYVSTLVNGFGESGMYFLNRPLAGRPQRLNREQRLKGVAAISRQKKRARTRIAVEKVKGSERRFIIAGTEVSRRTLTRIIRSVGRAIPGGYRVVKRRTRVAAEELPSDDDVVVTTYNLSGLKASLLAGREVESADIPREPASQPESIDDPVIDLSKMPASVSVSYRKSDVLSRKGCK